jgi:hypothetical protein
MATIAAAATTNATCTSPTSSRPAGSAPSQVTADASVPTSWLGASATAASVHDKKQTAGDQANDIARMAVAGRGQTPCRVAHGRSWHILRGPNGYFHAASCLPSTRRWIWPTIKAVTTAHEIPSRIPATASDSQWAPR